MPTVAVVSVAMMYKVPINRHIAIFDKFMHHRSPSTCNPDEPYEPRDNIIIVFRQISTGIVARVVLNCVPRPAGDAASSFSVCDLEASTISQQTVDAMVAICSLA